MRNFQPHIVPVYPANNFKIFEEWFAENYSGCSTDRELLPVFFTSYLVNNDYGNDKAARAELSNFLTTLDKSKKWFTIIQYDDGSMIDWRLYGLDVLEFNMSKQNGVMLPLICMPHPYNFTSGKKYLANFVGSRTHPIRDRLANLIGKEDYYVSFEPHAIQDYLRIMQESVFTLCPRGYGANSFRTCEAIQYGSIPVYISNEHILPFGIDFNDFGVLVGEEDAGRVDEILRAIPYETIHEKAGKLKDIYEKHYTYRGCMENIINELNAEYHRRQEGGEATPAVQGT